MESHRDIRIGTLVKANRDPETVAQYIREILPHGFESFQLIFWQKVDVDLGALAKAVNRELIGSGAVVSSLAVFGNPMGDEETDEKTRKGWRDLADAASDFGCDIVAGFAGRVRGKPIDESMARYEEVFSSLADHAQKKGVRLAFENCDMGGTWKTGDWNIAQNPTAWRMMFEKLPAENIGLCWEPCHQMVSLIDPMPQLREWVGKIFHVHGKDATVLWENIRRYGVHSSEPFAFHRTPGFGDSNWTDIITELRRGGFTGSIDIEGWHDPVYRGELEMTGQVHGLNYLKQCRGGTFVPNPSA